MTDKTTGNTKGRRPPRRRRRGRRRSRDSTARPVPLDKRTSSHFEPADRQRGAQYLRDGHVQLQIEGRRARARVRGQNDRVYDVGLDWTEVVPDRVLHVHCGCRRFASGRPCKHVWATLLAVTAAGEEHQPPGRDRLALRKDRTASWVDLDGAEGQGFTTVQAAAPAQQVRAKTVRLKPPSRVPKGRSQRVAGNAHDHVAGAVTWRSQIAAVREDLDRAAAGRADEMPPSRGIQVRFVVDSAASLDNGEIVVDVFEKAGGVRKGAKPKRASVATDELEALLLPPASEEASPAPPVVVAAQPVQTVRGRRGKPKTQQARVRRFQLPRSLYLRTLPHLAAHNALAWWDGRDGIHPLSWEGGPAWQLVLRLEITTSGTGRLRGHFERQKESVPLSSAMLILPVTGGGRGEPGTSLLFFEGTVGLLETNRERDSPWIGLLRDEGEMIIPKKDLEEALIAFLEMPALPRFDLPEEFRLREERLEPQPRLVLEPDSAPEWLNPQLLADLSFVYDGLEVNAGDSRAAIVDWQERRFLRRDAEREHAALVQLLELGFQPIAAGQGHGLELDPSELPAVAEPLLHSGWTVEVHGRSLRPPKPAALRVESGIDWFELSGSLDFEGDQIELAEVLKAISRGERFVTLGDGSQGLLPAAYVETCDSLAQLALSSSDEGLRFLPSQALLVDTLLAVMPPANVDRAFAELREKLRSFESIKPKKELRGFEGELRGYQRDGLGWLDFLREFGLGGVLADDMGLGKTVQVLALIQAHRTPAKTTKRPFLVVAPRSLVYNWKDEAARFTPKLKVVEYSGPDREKLRSKLDEHDLVVTTYGTLRLDIGFLATVEFDTVILDEAQAIKNPSSQTAKASNLVVARHRLALTGTPIENHLGELGSIFEFLNPGLLGRMPKLDVLASGRTASRDQLAKVAEGIRPFILRRTKAQVLPDLPPKTEQILSCTLSARQQEIYDQIRAAYQASLLPEVEKKGVGSSSIQVLEALLRLRQVACHPGLVREEWNDAGSSKLEALFEQVSEVLDEGHKVLVFSQFTKLLAYVRRHLDGEGVDYAYLDGQTRNRGEIVERFQTDPSCNLFLVSLKAGGFGLNLTAAGYVFLLDPWWNPAVEAQAIDRAHRIGQTQPVFAYRMIAQGTVEEKILDLQRSKRQIADAILEGGEGQSLRDLTADDLRMLLS